MRSNGFTSPEGVSACGEGVPTEREYCIVTVLDGTVVFEASMGPDLARGIESGDFERDQSFVTTAENRSAATELRLNLQAGALPTSLDFDRGTESFISPALAENFKLYSLITGLVAVFAVVVVVFFRYGDPKVAAPMVVTALSEVAILLGFAAAVGMALDLSHIAGLIAVIGTGVDDLIIIADEVMAQGDVSSARVFRNRFRKAFWVIGAAAITTIIAMSPLAFLQLGDLRGFAIVTILGVIVGVLVTRPAYGDILRSLLTDR
jgi:preprotein translocase subunit SecD